MKEEYGLFVRYTYKDLEIIKIGSVLESNGCTYTLKNSVSVESIAVMISKNIVQYEVYCIDYNGGVYYLYLDEYMNEISEPMGT